MRHAFAATLLLLLAASPCLGQSGDSETLNSILGELRAIHNDVRLGQTTQILLTELELEQSAVQRALEKRDTAKTRLTQTQDTLKNFAAQQERLQDAADAATDPQQKKQMTQQMDQFKAQAAIFRSQEQDRSTELADAESALRKEQDTLGNIQDQLNAVVKKLQPAAAQ